MNEPTQSPVQHADQLSIDALKKSNKRKLIWGLICIILPTVLIIASIVLYAILNFIFAGMAAEPNCPNTIEGGLCGTSSDNLFADTPPAQAITNVILFILGAFSVLTWLPGLIVGIILLATRKPLPTAK